MSKSWTDRSRICAPSTQTRSRRNESLSRLAIPVARSSCFRLQVISSRHELPARRENLPDHSYYNPLRMGAGLETSRAKRSAARLENCRLLEWPILEGFGCSAESHVPGGLFGCR